MVIAWRRGQSAADRKARFVAARNEIGALAAVRHPRVRERCRRDLEAFGWYYCRRLLDHRASGEIRERLVQKMQEAVLNGGQLAVEFTRGAGKTTWAVIAIVWAMLYGHRRFPVCIAASKLLAKSIKNAVYEILESSPEVAADWPAVAAPLRAIGGIVQRASSITYRGRPVEFASSEMMFRLPTLRDDAGHPLEAACGAILACRGALASVRGLNEMGMRPDFILLDDPQTQKDAASASAVGRLDTYIHADALNLGANTSTMAAFLTITPQRAGDLASRIADKTQHPNWSVSVCPFLIETCPDFESLADDFAEAYRTDAANDDFTRTASRAWYAAHRERFAAVRTVDPLAYDKATEYDAVHHALVRMAAVGKAAFLAEYQMRVAAGETELAITAEQVANALSGSPMCVLPPGTENAVAFCDVNIQKGKGLSWGVLALGRGRVASIVAYGRWPESGQLVPRGASDLARTRAVAAAIRGVTAHIAALDLRTAHGRRKVQIRALGFDRGYMPEVVCRALHVIRKRFALPFQLCAVRGFGWRQFGNMKKDQVGRGDHMFVTRSEYGEYLAVHAPYWREIAQSGFLETPLMPGSCSVFGTDALRHWQFAQEVAAEHLVRRYLHPSGKIAWDWAVQGENHYCDMLTGCFALASWFRLYDALPRVMDGAAAHAMPPADLFDPMRNPSISGPPAPPDGTVDVPATQADGLKTLEEWRRERAAALQAAAAQGAAPAAPRPARPAAPKRLVKWKRRV